MDLLNWAFLFIALSAMALLLRSLSRRLGEALQMKKYYYLYGLSIVVLAIATVMLLLGYTYGVLAIPARIMFFGGAVLTTAVTLRYWVWILPEIFKASK